ncbi:protein FAM184A-like [Littorina saxatilis]|uniref:Uncharacterized protein n=1 Tax=Littorina saxatilis TaxID=31220 RepID=A0AAN9C380_9CAEN
MATTVTAAGNDKTKRSFEFRMSKKVAELTQVVHMLFTRNHEKEVEIEALKEAYEFEISEVIEDAQKRIGVLERLQEESMKHQAGDVDRIRKLLEGEFQSKEQDWDRKLEETERLLQEERSECQNLRDMLIGAQRDIENLRHSVSKQMNSQVDETTRREREVEKLRKQVAQLEQSLRECSKEGGELVKELQRNNDSLERELRQVHSALDESHGTRDQLLVRNKQLEADMKALKRDFNRKVSEVVNGQKLSRNGTGSFLDQNEELERLRREIHRYRLELSNRDANFNRMFTDKQPIHVDRSVTGLKLQTSHSAGTMHHVAANGANLFSALKREKTVVPPSGPVICFEEQASQHLADRQRSMSTPSTLAEGRDSRFPSICSTPDIKPRPSNGRLTKPRPLPKEMLYGK